MKLHDYETGEELRDATLEELRASIHAVRYDGGAGAIRVGDRICYVVGEPPRSLVTAPSADYVPDAADRALFDAAHEAYEDDDCVIDRTIPPDRVDDGVWITARVWVYDCDDVILDGTEATA